MLVRLSQFRFLLPLSVMALLLIATTTTQAAPPKVATSIKPVQALVKMVMGPLGDPSVVIPATASPHTFALKPSQAQTLENAEVVFWIGPSLESALKGPLDNIAEYVQVVALLDTPGLDLIETGDPHGGDHDHGAVDPHIWLSPKNALVLVDAIAAKLSAIDPANEPDYRFNTKKARQRIKGLIRQVNNFTLEMRPFPYLVQHDGFGYLARDFQLNEAGHIQTMPGREPGAKHVAELMARIKAENIKCLFHEAQFSPKLARTLEKEARIGLREIDPMGVYIDLSERSYVRIIQAIIMSMETCLYPRQSIDLKPTPQ